MGRVEEIAPRQPRLPLLLTMLLVIDNNYEGAR